MTDIQQSNHFATIFLFCFPILCAIVVVFSLVHLFRPLESIYFPFSSNTETASTSLRIQKRSLIEGFRACFQTSSDRLLQCAGPDAAAVIILLNCLLQFFVAITPITIVVLLPVHVYFSSKATITDDVGGAWLYSIDFVPSGSSYLYIHVFASYAVFIIFYLFVLKAYNQASRTKASYAVKCATRPRNSILLHDLPIGFSSCDILRYLSNLYLQPIESVVVLRSSPKLQREIDLRHKAVLEIESLVDSIDNIKDLLQAPLSPILSNDGLNSPSRLSPLKPVVQRVAQITGIGAGSPETRVMQARIKLAKYDSRVAMLRQAYLENSTPSSTAIISFKSPFTAAFATSTTLSTDFRRFNVEICPFPEDLIHANLVESKHKVFINRLLASAAALAIIIFAAIIMTFFNTLFNLEKYKDNDFVRTVLESKFFSRFVQSILPTLGQTIFIALVPTILTILANMCKYRSKSQTELNMCTNFFYFQLVTIPLFNVASTLLLEVPQLNDPTIDDLLKSMSTNISKGAGNTLLFVVFQSCITIPLTLLMLVRLILRLFLGSGKSPRARFASCTRISWPAIELSGTMLCLTIGLMLCIICPLIIAPTILCSVISMFVWKYRLLFQVQVSDTQGRLFPRLVNMIFVGLILMLLFTISQLFSKKFAPVLLLLPLIIFLFFIKAKINALGTRLRTDSLEAWRDWESQTAQVESGNINSQAQKRFNTIPSGEFQGVNGIEDSHPLIPYGDSLRTGLLTTPWIDESSTDYLNSLVIPPINDVNNKASPLNVTTPLRVEI